MALIQKSYSAHCRSGGEITVPRRNSVVACALRTVS
jgi:hypothetical protein